MKTSNPKKSGLIAYWVKSYTHFIRNENKFVSNFNYKLKRGQIIQVDFGFRLGKELGGLHYAVVLDNNNNLHSPIVTVVPLTSLKENYNPNCYTKQLKDGVYGVCYNKIEKQLDDNEKLIKETIALRDNLFSGYISEYGDTPLIKTYTDNITKSMVNIKKFKKQISDLEYLKRGSIANFTQITTISKMRIKRPRIKEPLDKNDLLYNVRLSSYDMQIINDALKKDYIFYK